MRIIVTKRFSSTVMGNVSRGHIYGVPGDLSREYAEHLIKHGLAEMIDQASSQMATAGRPGRPLGNPAPDPAAPEFGSSLPAGQASPGKIASSPEDGGAKKKSPTKTFFKKRAK